MRSSSHSATLLALAVSLGTSIGAQVTPRVSFGGSAWIGTTAVLHFDDWTGNQAAVAISLGLREQPLATPWGSFWLDGTALTIFSGTMVANRRSWNLPIPADANLVGAQLFAQALSLQNGMTAPAHLTVRAAGIEPTVTLRTLVIDFDPIIESRGGRRLHEVAGWSNPRDLLRQYLLDLRQTSGGFADYQAVAFLELDVWPRKIDGFRYDDASYLQALATNTWHQPDAVDYDRIIADYDLVARVNSGEIDEVIMYGAPYFGFYESRMAGPNAYWCNSPGMSHVPTLRKFVLMGFNYERGYAEAFHSFGHRVESIMVHVYGSWSSGAPQHAWDAFTRFDKITPGLAACGNIHFPPNGIADYDYGNTTRVVSRADDWLRNWPSLVGVTRAIDASEWQGSHHGFMRWWHDHLPRRPGLNPDGKQNNWWKYVVDFNRYVESR